MLLQIFPDIIYKENLSISSYSLDNIKFEKEYSLNNKVLNLKEFKKIKELIEIHIKKYTHDILEISKELNFYITRSWIIKRDKAGLKSLCHQHTNSFFTGVLYLNLDEGKDSIIFEKPDYYSHIKYDFENPNIYNQIRVNFFPKKNDLLIFDARLLHQIGPHLTTNPRICLAFEIIAKGAFGNKNNSASFNKGILVL